MSDGKDAHLLLHHKTRCIIQNVSCIYYEIDALLNFFKYGKRNEYIIPDATSGINPYRKFYYSYVLSERLRLSA